MSIQVPNLASPEASVLRLSLLQKLKALVDADIATFYDVVYEPGVGVLRSGRILVDGPSDAEMVFGRLEGSVFGDFDVSVDEAPPVDQWGKAGRDVVSAGVLGAVWDPLGIHSAIGMLVSDGEVLLGGLDLFRSTGRPAFGDAELDACRRLRMEPLQTVRAAAQLASTSSHRWTVVIDASGDVLMSANGASEERLLETPIIRAQVARCFEQGVDHYEMFLERDRVQLTRMVSASGANAFLVMVSPMLGMALPDVMRLSIARRRVAAYAAAGCTAVEIADELGRSPHTIRSHLKAIYSELGVASRTELARLVENLWVRHRE